MCKSSPKHFSGSRFVLCGTLPLPGGCLPPYHLTGVMASCMQQITLCYVGLLRACFDVPQGVRCHAWLYVPALESDDINPPPVVIVAHGIGAQKVKTRFAVFALGKGGCLDSTFIQLVLRLLLVLLEVVCTAAVCSIEVSHHTRVACEREF